MWYSIRRMLALLGLLTAVFTTGAQTTKSIPDLFPPDPGTRTVVFNANGGTFATGKTPGEYMDENTTFTVAGVGLGEKSLFTRYAPSLARVPEGKVLDKWYTSSSGTGGDEVTDATALAAGTGAFNLYAIYKVKPLEAEDFVVKLPASLVYDGNQKAPQQVATKPADLGTVTLKYKLLPNGQVTSDAPSAAGSYQLLADVTIQGGEAQNNIEIGIMTITKAPQAQPAGVTAENATSGNDGKIINVNNNMEYRAIGETEYTEITEAEVTDLVPGIYYVRLEGNDNHLPGTDLAITVAQGATPVYTVTFITEGVVKFADQNVRKDAKAVKPVTDPVRTNYTFTEWKTDAVGTGAFDFNQPVTEHTTVYAGWEADPTFNVSGTVTDSEQIPNPLDGVTVIVHPLEIRTTTNSSGEFTLGNVSAGSYNLIATDANGNSVTLFITVTEQTTINQPIRINGKANSRLVVEAGAPEVVVDKLDELAVGIQAGGADNILIKLVASPCTEDTAEGATDIKDAMANDGMQMSAILDLSLFKKVNEDTPVKLEELAAGEMIEVIIPIPEPLRGNKAFALYRYHNPAGGVAAVHVITTTPNADGEKIEVAVDRSCLTATLKKFSSYALGTAPTYTVSYMLDAVTVFKTESVAGQGLATKPSPDPVKSGYTLEAWCRDAAAASVWNFATDKVTGNLSLYPKWKVNAGPGPSPSPDPTPGPPVGIENVYGDALRVYGATGAIVIEGGTVGAYRVVSLSGPTSAMGYLKDDRTEIALPAGIYVITLNKKSWKVIVK